MAHRLSVYTLTLLFLLLVNALSTSLIAAPGDELVVTGSIVNLRERPSTDATVLLKLGQDRRVVEIKREADWVEIFTNRDDVITGWVHSSLLAPPSDHNIAITNHSDQYTRFMQTFNHLNESWQQQNGYLPFISVEEFTNRRIRITASTEWLNTEQTHREQMLSLIFDHWSKAVGNGMPIDIEVVDQNGERHMTMFR